MSLPETGQHERKRALSMHILKVYGTPAPVSGRVAKPCLRLRAGRLLPHPPEQFQSHIAPGSCRDCKTLLDPHRFRSGPPVTGKTGAEFWEVERGRDILLQKSPSPQKIQQ